MLSELCFSGSPVPWIFRLYAQNLSNRGPDGAVQRHGACLSALSSPHSAQHGVLGPDETTDHEELPGRRLKSMSANLGQKLETTDHYGF